GRAERTARCRPNVRRRIGAGAVVSPASSTGVPIQRASQSSRSSRPISNLAGDEGVPARPSASHTVTSQTADRRDVSGAPSYSTWSCLEPATRAAVDGDHTVNKRIGAAGGKPRLEARDAARRGTMSRRGGATATDERSPARLSAEARRSQLLDVTAELVMERGAEALTMEA